ncbi:UDP-glucose 4-epimerase GalE [Cellulomonas xiejunii]|uniref:UDP-glucose 4-epimerase n=1 Tax=Cellulomonas xiejunii TaxID=2968083 RepID=A0ABY5KNJ4_9CELL|nr:UDP-glucose 4-epimerase GalE [Cellulomonas xiejunii]MCC2316162.1 UDP-glucose 4-epimerase GalE [Cellulomonas xiejunii]MCC2320749.1 UDP-glucose 4-epimerase GalE [Cellulomonas xiejunii]UUI71036.1 UDP-glucose 4-epimerase GalE [Cellulomonas xiejunii]
MTWLVTGGAGYIGAHVVHALRDAAAQDPRLRPVVLDDLSSGHADFVPDDVPFVRASVLDTAAVRAALVEHEVTGVIHLAGFKYAGVSVQRPLHTYEQNVTGTAHLLDAMAAAGVDQVVYSSSAAVYGTPDVDVVTESTPTHPESPYGESKLVGEWLLRDQGVATGLRHTSLRYFNVVGSGSPDLYDSSPHNLFPLVLDALASGRTPRVHGVDHPTPDGTCVRDYVHVADLAASHVAAARALADGRPLERVYNLGSGEGLSVAQVMTTVARVTGIDFTPEVGPRRPGDPARIVASGEAAARDLGWAVRHTPEQMVASAWEARRRTP